MHMRLSEVRNIQADPSSTHAHGRPGGHSPTVSSVQEVRPLVLPLPNILTHPLPHPIPRPYPPVQLPLRTEHPWRALGYESLDNTDSRHETRLRPRTSVSRLLQPLYDAASNAFATSPTLTPSLFTVSSMYDFCVRGIAWMLPTS